MNRIVPHIAAFALVTLSCAAAYAQRKSDAQSYPARPVRMVMPNTPGSAMDMVGRMIAQRFSETWGQQVVVDNRAGAAGIVGHEIAAKSVADGYTILFSSSAGLIVTPILQKVPYDSYRDFAPLSLIVISPQMLVSNPSVPAATVDELVALAKAKPKQLHCASPGTGTSNHLGCETLKMMAGIDIVHVPYKGTGPAITDVMGGQVQFMFNSLPAVWPLAKAGKLRAIAHGGTTRSPAAPTVPTIAESIPGFQCQTWYAMLAPRGTPGPILAKVSADLQKLLNEPSFSKKLADQGQDPKSSTPAELTAYMRAESERFAKIIKAAGITAAP